MRWKLFLFIVCLLGVFPAHAQEANDLLGRINNLRAQHGLPGYTLNAALMVAAQQQAQWIVDTGTIAHTHPDGSGPRTRALAAGYPSTDVGENIYGGTNATVNDAWTFWLNSPIHFQGLVSTNYQEVGIGIAHGSWGSSFVLDFGGSGAPPPAALGVSNPAGGQPVAASGPPAYYGGIDESGNIKHIVQPGDTLGDIALLYGYTWSDLPYMMQLNGLTDVHDLEVGSVFLVPPHAGTFTPTPDNRPPTDVPPPSPIPATITPFVVMTPTLPPEFSELTVVVPPILTAGANIQPPQNDDPATSNDDPVTQVAAVPTPAVLTAAAVPPRATNSTWIMIAVGVQVVVVVGAGIEFLRRAIRRRR